MIQLSDIFLSELKNAKIYLTKSITVKTIIHSLIPLEYLPTSEKGIAIIYHVEGQNNKKAAFADINIKFIIS